jgi:PIN domain nuclease of toxin-antitoxin system
MLAHRNRIALEGDILSWQRRAIALEKLEVLGVTPEIAVRAASLQASRGGDPADWFIVATALELQVPLVSRDDNLAAAGLVEVVW